MSRIIDPQPYYKSIEPPKEEPHTKRSGLRGLGADSPEWWPGYVDGVIEAVSQKDRAREYNELARGKSTAPTAPICTTRLK